MEFTVVVMGMGKNCQEDSSYFKTPEVFHV